MKKPFEMRLDELMALPAFTATGVLDRALKFGGCFRDRDGRLWGTCLIDDVWERYPGVWARFPAVHLAEQTGLSQSVLSQRSSLRGFIDSCDGISTYGWAQDEADPTARIDLDLSVNGTLLTQIVADQFRGDLVDAGIGDGWHGFHLTLPAPLSRKSTQIVVAQKTQTGDVLDVAVLAPKGSA